MPCWPPTLSGRGLAWHLDADGLRKVAAAREAELPTPSPRVVRETPVTALIDADAGLGHPAAVMGMELAIAKARLSGLAAVSVFNSHHFGAAGYLCRAWRRGKG